MNIKAGDYNEIKSFIKADLNRVKKLITSALPAGGGDFGRIAGEILIKPGKMVRPVLALLSGRTGREPDGRNLALFAAAVELFHNFTLIHDDIIDGTPERRNKKTVNLKFGRRPAILAGDYLFAKAFGLMSEISIPEIVTSAADTAQIMCFGEFYEIQNEGNLKLSLKEYLKIIEMKTASLFSFCCYGAGLIGKADKKLLENLRNFGRYFGVIYQLNDDFKDIKEDIRNNKITLPIILLFKKTRKDVFKFSDKETDKLLLDYEITREISDIKKKLLQDAESELENLKGNIVRERLISLINCLL